MTSRALRFAASLLVLAALAVLLLPFAAGAQVTVAAPTAADTIPPVRRLPTWAVGQACPQVRDTTRLGRRTATAYAAGPRDSATGTVTLMRTAWLWGTVDDPTPRAWIMVKAQPIATGSAGERFHCLGYVRAVYATSGPLAYVPAVRWYAPSLRAGAVGEYVHVWTLPAAHADRFLMALLAGFARYPSLSSR